MVDHFPMTFPVLIKMAFQSPPKKVDFVGKPPDLGPRKSPILPGHPPKKDMKRRLSPLRSTPTCPFCPTPSAGLWKVRPPFWWASRGRPLLQRSCRRMCGDLEDGGWGHGGLSRFIDWTYLSCLLFMMIIIVTIFLKHIWHLLLELPLATWRPSTPGGWLGWWCDHHLSSSPGNSY